MIKNKLTNQELLELAEYVTLIITVVAITSALVDAKSPDERAFLARALTSIVERKQLRGEPNGYPDQEGYEMYR